MALQFTYVDEPSFSRGIDARSAENQIRDGFVRDLVNGDIVEGRVRKRKGYEAFAGNIPLRVIRYQQPEVGRAIVSLDGSIDLSRVEGRPILLYGKSSVSTSSPNPFTSTADRTWWFTSWETNLRKVFNASTTGIITATATEHSVASTDMYVGVSENTDANTDQLSGELLTTSISVDASSRLVTVNYTNNRTTPVPVFLYYLDRSPEDGTTFAQNNSTALDGASTFTILASTHGLSTSNILYQLYQFEGGSWIQSKPDSFSCASNGDISYTVTAGSGVQFRMILSAVSDAQVTEGGSTILLANQPNSYLFYTCYNGTSEIIPDTVIYNDDDKSVVFTFSGEEVPEDVRICYEYGIIRTNEIYLDNADFGAGPFSGSFATVLTDNAPQLTLYGIGHDIAYGDNKRNFRRGWVNHIDSYRSPNDTHIVAGLGGNLYAALDAEMPTYYPNLRARVSGEQHVGPAFGSASSPRTRGIYSFTGSNTGWAEVISAEWTVSGVEYTLSTPGRSSTSASPVEEGDYLTLKGMPFSKHNGTFRVVDVTELDSDHLVIVADNPNVANSDYDDSGCSGSGGIFSDRFGSNTNPNPFLPGDRLLSSSWGDETELYVSDYNLNVLDYIDVNGNPVYRATDSVHLLGCYDNIRLGSNLLVTGERTSDTVSFRTVANIRSVDYLVPGDTVSFSGQDNLLQIVSLDTDPTKCTVTFDSTITWRDSVTLPPTFQVVNRWLPVESPAPDTGDVLIPSTSIRYFTSDDYDNQSFLRSAMVQNNLYLTNGKDEVYKYDGTHNYRAGIIPWQPGLFLTYETIPTGGIPLIGVIADDGGGSGKLLELVGGRIKIDKTQAEYFDDGDTVVIEDGTVIGTPRYFLTIKGRELESSGNHYFFSFVEPIPFTTLGSGATVRMILAYVARYYFRLNIKDVNGVVTSSAVTGAEDFVARVTPTTSDQQKVHIRLVGLPAWDQYDFRNKNIEIEIYRTFWTRTGIGEVPVFSRLPQTKVCSFAGADGYIDVIDTYSNDTLLGPDLTVGVLSPNTIPAAWDEPPRAKYVTTAGNRLVMANLTDWPTLAVSYLAPAAVSYSSFAGQKFTFYRDSSSTSSAVTDMVSQATYELVSGAGTTLAVGAFSSWSEGFSFSLAASPPAVGDWVYLSLGSVTSHPLDFCGWWQVADVVGSGPYVCKIRSSKPYVAPSHGHVAYFASTSKNIPVNIDIDYNMNMVNGQVVGFAAPEIRIIRRVGEAINATMRMTDTKLSAYSSFKPWMIARSESDTSNQLIVKQPRVEDTLLAVKTTFLSTIATYVNGNQVTGTTVTPASITRYPSRLAVSYDNYPEIFDNLWAVNADDSDSILDINSSDGQEITGVIPFFGDSAFGAALQSSVLVVFKQNSIYLVDLSAKLEGKNAVQRLQTQGLGCTAPYSIAPTKNGIAFANDSGIYVLRTNQTIEYLGRYMERNWQEKVDGGALSIAQGHHFGVGRQYKLSVPLAAESSSTYAENSEVYVYSHTGEADGELGGWARYTNHPVTGWANLFQNAFLATANGSVMRVRSSGGVSDYRDGNEAIEAVLETRATSFGNPTIRKTVSNIVINYRSDSNSNSTFVYTAPDLFNDYTLSTLFRVVTKGIKDGLSSPAGRAIVSVLHSIGRRRCIYMSVKIVNSAVDENVEIAGISYVVAGLSPAGVKQAAET